MTLLGQQHQEILQQLLSCVQEMRRSTDGKRIVVLRGSSGVGKSQIVRCLYEALRQGEEQPAYWPPLPEVVRATGAGVDPLAARKKLGPNVTDFRWEEGALPSFTWWSFECQRLSQGDLLTWQQSWSELFLHALPAGLSLALRDPAVRRRRAVKRLLPTLARDVVNHGSEEAAQELAKLVIKEGVPFLGLALDWARSARDAVRQGRTDRSLLESDVTYGGLPEVRLKAGAQREGQLLGSLAAKALPAILVVEDAHWMGPDLKKLLDTAISSSPSRSVLVILTAWPDVPNSELDGWVNWAETLNLASVFDIRPLLPSDLMQLAQEAIPDMEPSTAQMISSRFQNPLAMLMFLHSDYFERLRRNPDLDSLSTEDLLVIPHEVRDMYSLVFAELGPGARSSLTELASVLPPGWGRFPFPLKTALAALEAPDRGKHVVDALIRANNAYIAVYSCDVGLSRFTEDISVDILQEEVGANRWRSSLARAAKVASDGLRIAHLAEGLSGASPEWQSLAIWRNAIALNSEYTEIDPRAQVIELGARISRAPDEDIASLCEELADVLEAFDHGDEQANVVRFLAARRALTTANGGIASHRLTSVLVREIQRSESPIAELAWRAYREHGLALIQRGRWKTAIVWLNRALDSPGLPSLAASHFVRVARGVAEAALGDYDSAIVDFESGWESFSTRANGFGRCGIRLHWGSSLYMVDRLSEAERQGKAALQEPNITRQQELSAWELLASISEQQGAWDSYLNAQGYILSLRTGLDWDTHLVQMNRVRAFFKLGMRTDAVGAARTAMDFAPEQRQLRRWHEISQWLIQEQLPDDAAEIDVLLFERGIRGWGFSQLTWMLSTALQAGHLVNAVPIAVAAMKAKDDVDHVALRDWIVAVCEALLERGDASQARIIVNNWVKHARESVHLSDLLALYRDFDEPKLRYAIGSSLQGLVTDDRECDSTASTFGLACLVAQRHMRGERRRQFCSQAAGILEERHDEEAISEAAGIAVILLRLQAAEPALAMGALVRYWPTEPTGSDGHSLGLAVLRWVCEDRLGGPALATESEVAAGVAGRSEIDQSEALAAIRRTSPSLLLRNLMEGVIRLGLAEI